MASPNFWDSRSADERLACIGVQRPSLCCSNFAWEVLGVLRQYWNGAIQPRIDTIYRTNSDHIHKSDDTRSAVAYDILLLAPTLDPDTARPNIVIHTADSEVAERFIQLIKTHELFLRLNTQFDVLYDKRKVVLPKGDEDFMASQDWISSSISLCGASVLLAPLPITQPISWRHVTISCVIQLGDRYYAILPAHVFYSYPEDETNSGNHEDHDDHSEAESDTSMSATSDEPRHGSDASSHLPRIYHPKQRYALYLNPNRNKRLSSDSAADVCSNIDVAELTLLGEFDPNSEAVRRIIRPSICHDLDYALVEIRDIGFQNGNTIVTGSGDFMCPTRLLPSSSRSIRKVLIATGSSGVQEVRVSSTTATLIFPWTNAPRKVWQLDFTLGVGDSGSIVLTREGYIIGMAVGTSCGDNITYVIPATDILRSIVQSSILPVNVDTILPTGSRSTWSTTISRPRSILFTPESIFPELLKGADLDIFPTHEQGEDGFLMSHVSTSSSLSSALSSQYSRESTDSSHDFDAVDQRLHAANIAGQHRSGLWDPEEISIIGLWRDRNILHYKFTRTGTGWTQARMTKLVGSRDELVETSSSGSQEGSRLVQMINMSTYPRKQINNLCQRGSRHEDDGSTWRLVWIGKTRLRRKADGTLAIGSFKIIIARIYPESEEDEPTTSKDRLPILADDIDELVACFPNGKAALTAEEDIKPEELVLRVHHRKANSVPAKTTSRHKPGLNILHKSASMTHDGPGSQNRHGHRTLAQVMGDSRDHLSAWAKHHATHVGPNTSHPRENVNDDRSSTTSTETHHSFHLPKLPTFAHHKPTSPRKCNFDDNDLHREDTNSSQLSAIREAIPLLRRTATHGSTKSTSAIARTLSRESPEQHRRDSGASAASIKSSHSVKLRHRRPKRQDSTGSTMSTKSSGSPRKSKHDRDGAEAYGSSSPSDPRTNRYSMTSTDASDTDQNI